MEGYCRGKTHKYAYGGSTGKQSGITFQSFKSQIIIPVNSSQIQNKILNYDLIICVIQTVCSLNAKQRDNYCLGKPFAFLQGRLPPD